MAAHSEPWMVIYLITLDPVVSGNPEQLSSPLLGEALQCVVEFQRQIWLRSHVLSSCMSHAVKLYKHKSKASLTIIVAYRPRGIVNPLSSLRLYLRAQANKPSSEPSLYQISPSLGNCTLLVLQFSLQERIVIFLFVYNPYPKICFGSLHINTVL